jgi:SAM-dependent methyltransferase
MCYGPEFISKELDLWAFMRGVTLDFSRPGKPTDNAFVESLNGKFRAVCLNANWFLSLDEARRNARLGVETTTRCARTAQSATKCLRCFLGRPVIPATGPPDEARRFQRKAVQGWGQVQLANRLYSSLDEEGAQATGLKHESNASYALADRPRKAR